METQNNKVLPVVNQITCGDYRYMRFPEMILFDYYKTLCYEPDGNALRGIAEVMRNAVANPRNLTAEEVEEFASGLFASVCGPVRAIGMEISYHYFLRLLYEYLEIELDVPVAEAERIYWDSFAPGAAIPYANDMLAYLHRHGIRTGVISNIRFSGEALRARLDRLLPDNHLEFVIASSEYIIRKPNTMLFELALRKAGLKADRVWFCGDSPNTDIAGAASVGIFPVLYDNEAVRKKPEKKSVAAGVEHLHIHDWRELMKVLDNLA